MSCYTYSRYQIMGTVRPLPVQIAMAAAAFSFRIEIIIIIKKLTVRPLESSSSPFPIGDEGSLLPSSHWQCGAATCAFPMLAGKRNSGELLGNFVAPIDLDPFPIRVEGSLLPSL